MGISEKINFVVRHPKAVADYFHLERQLSRNRKEGIYNFLFQCDAKGHFPYLNPYYDVLKSNKNVDVYFSGANLDGDVSTFLMNNGVSSDRIIRHNSLVKLTDWDIYMSPTSWGNIFPKNKNCFRIQISVALAEKNIQPGENLINFDTIFVNGPTHHDVLKRILFDPFPAAKTRCKTFDVGFAKIDQLLNGYYDHETIRKILKIAGGDSRKIILYAPNWENTSALYKYRDSVFEVLKKTDYIILIKLHYISMLSAEKLDSTGDLDIRRLLDRYGQEENMRIIRGASIDPYMSLSSLLITDYGGAALEFMCTGKPIVYLDCPEFFDIRGKDILEYRSRDSGYLISDVERLPETVEYALRGDASKVRAQAELVDRLLYNRGSAAEAGIRVIFEQLLARKSRWLM